MKFDKDIYDIDVNSNNYCISVWQPWASLIVNGIKRFEGRKWKTDY